jgi:hypothetical protein
MLNANGTSLIYSTYIGGNQKEFCESFALDSSGNAYIAGSTQSIDYDITPGAFQTINNGNSDLFVTKLDFLPLTSTLEIAENNSLAISPNPSQGIYQIDFGNGSNNHIQIKILDMQGNLIEKHNLSNKHSTSIDLSKYASGLYILKVVSNNKQEISRLVKL